MAAQAKFLTSQGKKVPSAQGLALVDTGASRTAVDIDTAKKLGLPVIKPAKMSSASDPNVIVPVFAGRLEIPNFTQIDVPHGLMGVTLSGQKNSIVVLIGRDLLANAVLTYNGPDGSVTLAI